jgi:hypothetical protein
VISFDESIINPGLLSRMFDLLVSSKGQCEIGFEVRLKDGVCVVLESPAYRISGSRALEAELKKNGCAIDWQI